MYRPAVHPRPKHPGGLSLPSCCVWCIHLPVLRSYVPQTSRVGRHGRGTRPPDMSARRTAPLQGVRGAVSSVIYVAERMTVPGGDVQVRSGGLTGGAVLVRFGLTAQPCPVGRGGGDRDALEWNHFCTRLLRCACRATSRGGATWAWQAEHGAGRAASQPGTGPAGQHPQALSCARRWQSLPRCGRR